MAELGLPLFVKPANLGSSVGVSKVKTAAELGPALAAAFAYDRKVVVEAAVDAREIEVSVLGNDDAARLPARRDPARPRVLRLRLEVLGGEQDGAAHPRAPATRPRCDEVRALGVRAFRAVDACGYARVDFLLERKSGRALVNEINTIPGFTSISMFPKLWEASGVPYAELLARLVELGRDRHAERAALKTTYSK